MRPRGCWGILGGETEPLFTLQMEMWLQQMKAYMQLKIMNFTTHTTKTILCAISPFFSPFPSYWELGAAVHCIAQAETVVLCPNYWVCLGHSVFIAVHHRDSSRAQLHSRPLPHALWAPQWLKQAQAVRDTIQVLLCIATLPPLVQ